MSKKKEFFALILTAIVAGTLTCLVKTFPSKKPFVLGKNNRWEEKEYMLLRSFTCGTSLGWLCAKFSERGYPLWCRACRRLFRVLELSGKGLPSLLLTFLRLHSFLLGQPEGCYPCCRLFCGSVGPEHASELFRPTSFLLVESLF
ncbi:hypothetical protein PIB30_092647 [Stylosanthes scabra]|uniref:Uncharacterized protein n=1 Tax=Stylosanthes scabra TaxID=79078 RepID=A0ABU6TUH7_9FABA|nr:hypothetical protein [Stylosanthes scabra]